MKTGSGLAFLVSAPMVIHPPKHVGERKRRLFPVCQTTSGGGDKAKHVTLEPSYPQAMPANFPQSLFTSTIYHNIPSVPEHHANTSIAPLVHRNDGDGYVLAISFSSTVDEENWIRGRFVRTRPFFVESRTQKRVYRGLYGTPGAVGLNAPVKPKPSCAKGIFEWGDASNSRMVTYGLRTLPLSVSCDVLVTRGPTALGAVLTDSEELLEVRATELSVPPFEHNNSRFTAGMSRAATGKTIGAFVCELNEAFEVVKRFPKIAVPSSCNIVSATACDEFIVLALHRVSEEAGGFFSAVLGTGKQKKSPVVDVGFGTTLLILSRSTGKYTSCKLGGTIVTDLISASGSSDGLEISGIELSQQNSQVMRLSTIADSRCGRLWSSNESGNGFSSQVIRCTIQLKSNEKSSVATKFETRKPSDDIMVTDVMSKSANVRNRSAIQSTPYIVYDTSKRRSGVATMDENGSPLSIWLTEQTSVRLSGGCLSPDGDFFSVLATREGQDENDTSLALFDIDKIDKGPVERIQLDESKFGSINESVAGVWAAHSSSWDVDAKKPVKSSYEMFDSHDWNDINSSFTSLGV